MSWFYEKWSVPSERNGRIDCIRALGKWSVDVQGTNESSSYMLDLWRGAVRHVPKQTSVKRILMLGLAGGACVEMLHRRFPGCRITAIEWDPVMIDVMKRIRLFRPSLTPEILLGDAADIVPKLHRTFDLIVSDLFRGPHTPDQVKNDAFFSSLRSCLTRDGVLLLNVYEQPEMFQTAGRFFAQQSRWKFRLNHVAAYRPFGAGTVGDPLPDGYHPFRTTREYWTREIKGWPGATMVGTDRACGVRTWNGPLCLEKYYGDIEPAFDGTGPKRLIIWQRTVRNNIPPGWRRSFVQMNAHVTGFVDLDASDDPAFAWSPHAVRHLAHWNTCAQNWTVTAPAFHEFLPVYMKNSMRKNLKNLHRSILEQKAPGHGKLLRFIGLVRKTTGTMEAGFVALDIPELHQSIHVASFMLPGAKADDVGTGLVDLWFRQSRERGLRFCDFDLFRGPGDPKSWNGFTRFKSQFGTRFIRYPLPLLRWTGTWDAYFKHFTETKQSA